METKLTDESLMPFGSWKGKPIAEVPDWYLLKLYENGKCFGPIKIYIGENLDAIKTNVERENAMIHASKKH